MNTLLQCTTAEAIRYCHHCWHDASLAISFTAAVIAKTIQLWEPRRRVCCRCGPAQLTSQGGFTPAGLQQSLCCGQTHPSQSGPGVGLRPGRLGSLGSGTRPVSLAYIRWRAECSQHCMTSTALVDVVLTEAHNKVCSPSYSSLLGC